MGEPEPRERPSNFIRDAVIEDLRSWRFNAVVTRFPPEPNGYLHIGHAKAICLDFGLGQEFSGRCHLRFDDTNPTKESQEYVDAIMRDVRWLGFDWGQHLYYASDYFGQLYEWAEALIQKGLAYVCDLSPEEIAAYRGTLTEPGRASPWRDRSVEENLDLLRRMRARRVPRRHPYAAGQDRHGLGQPEPARPRDVPHPQDLPPSHRRQVVHLPDVRLGPRSVRLHRDRHPLAVHAGVRGPPSRSTTGTSRRWASITRARSNSPA